MTLTSMISKFGLCISLLVSLPLAMTAQELRATLSTDSHKVDRNNQADGVATVVIDSRVKDLTVNNEAGDELTKPNDGLFVYRIDTNADRENGFPVSNRIFLLNSPQSDELPLSVDDIKPKTVYYYTVILANQFPANLSFEYLFTKSSKVAMRVAFGKRIGFYLSCKWGDYKKAGADIDDVTEDNNVTYAKELGYIRTAITGGLRIGLLHKRVGTLYMLVGGGYGEYGRQWQNTTEINENIYFHSDYISGFDGDLVCQFVLGNWICLSAGADMLVGDSNISVDYQIGVGINLNFTKLFKRKN